jgi:glycosyltransferase involved in cell wall biosynthesis
MAPLINITIPVFNEANVLASTINTLNTFVVSHIPCPCEIVIANNGSTDQTLHVAQELESVHNIVRVLNLPEKGRGGALKRVWKESHADILTYMDCDLSTDLSCFMPLIKPLLAGTHDVSVGSRLLPKASITRGFKRTFISQCYNVLVRLMFKPQFSDAQCGFKAITKAAFSKLQQLIDDNGWFMDTELLLVAEKLGFRLFDLPVQWTDDPDSKVKILKTAYEDVKGLVRLKRRFASDEFTRPRRLAVSGHRSL